tara:strand:+ start:184 stop:579 length:396 start_codon:yes stop_codon:yes gene_type:complete
MSGWNFPIKLPSPDDWIKNAAAEVESGWKTGYDSGGVLGGVFGAATGGVIGTLGLRSASRDKYTASDSQTNNPTLKTHVAGQADNFGRFGDISQQAPGGWIRKQQKNRYGRASTILTRGTTRKAIQNRKGG